MPQNLERLFEAIKEGLMLHQGAFEKDVVTGVQINGRFEGHNWDITTQPQTSSKVLRERSRVRR